MSGYIGVEPVPKASRVKQGYVRTSPFTSLSVAGGYTVGNIEIHINGSYIHPENYDAVDGINVVFNEEIFAGPGADAAEIEIEQVRSFVLPAEDNVFAAFEYVGVAGQSVFTLKYDVGLIRVLYNGINLPSTAYTADDGSMIVLNSPVSVNDDVITIERWGKTNSTFLTDNSQALTEDDSTTTSLYPIMVPSVGSNQTMKASSSDLSFNASTGTLLVGNVNTGDLTAVSITETSSLRYKENIHPIENALDVVDKIQGVLYDRRDGTSKNESGLIAESLYDILPDLVRLDKDGNPDSIQYTRIIAYLVEAIKELRSEVNGDT